MRPPPLLRACAAALLSAVPLRAWQTLEVGGPTAVTADRCILLRTSTNCVHMLVYIVHI